MPNGKSETLLGCGQLIDARNSRISAMICRMSDIIELDQEIWELAKKIHNSRMGVGDTCEDCIRMAVEQINARVPRHVDLDPHA
jgi:hypothetical protein